MGIMGTLILIVLVSGCISNSSTTKTFSDGVMSFNYPGDFRDISSEQNNYSSSSWQEICHFGTDNILNTQAILVGKNTNGTSSAEERDKFILEVKNVYKGNIISITTETNSNGIVVEKIAYTSESPPFGLNRYNDMYYKINGVVYAISVYGPDSNKQQIINTTNIVFQSIK